MYAPKSTLNYIDPHQACTVVSLMEHFLNQYAGSLYNIALLLKPSNNEFSQNQDNDNLNKYRVITICTRKQTFTRGSVC